ncbi:hypothetical protein BaRGS_00021243, partial [Batillaria attramentaria]
CVVADTPSNDTEDCGTGWMYMHRACYRFTTQQMTWDNAQMSCESEGGYLLSISSVAEKNKVRKEMRKVDGAATWWIGLKHKRGNQWEWLDKGPFSPRVTVWVAGEPYKEGYKDCVDFASNARISDQDCAIEKPFICERQESKTTSFAPGVSENFEIKNTTNYKPPDTTTRVIVLTSSTTLRTTSESLEMDQDGDDIGPDDEVVTDPESTAQGGGQQNNNGNQNTNGHNNKDKEKEDKSQEEEEENNDKGEKRDKKDESNEREGGQDAKDEEEEEKEIDLFDLYEGCYLLSTRQDRGRPFLYTLGVTTCPRVKASQITWQETSANNTRREKCKQGSGSADDTESEPQEPEEAVALTKELANITDSDDVTAEDVMVTSKVIESLVTSGVGERIKNKTEVKNIVAVSSSRFTQMNVVRAGSNVVATSKSRMWSEMTTQDRSRSATSLLVAMETATVAMAEEIDEPTVINTKDENIELELVVVDVSSAAADDTEDIVYTADDSDNEFSIPVETLSHLSKGQKLAKVVFMTHYTMGDILDDDTDDVTGDTSDDGTADVSENDGDDGEKKSKADKPRLASYILSASVGGSTEPIKLPEPVSFTMTHTRPVPTGYHSLCSFWSISESGLGEWSQEGCWVVSSNANQTTCECDHMTNFAILMAVQEVKISDTHMSLLRLTTIVGCVISLMCLLASWITFTCFTSLQGERNSIHKNLVVCLFLACGLVAGFLHYFFLAAFLWMLMEGVHIVLMLVQVFDASRSRLPYYYAAAYAPPILIIAISAGLYHQGYGTDRYCWLTTERYFIWSFAGPVAVILLVNAAILVYAMTMVCRHSEYVFSGKEKNTAGGIRSWIQGALALEVLLGLTWVLGYFFISEQTLPIAYVFTVLNSLQGLFIFCFHCLFNKKVRRELKKVISVLKDCSTWTYGLKLSFSCLTEIIMHISGPQGVPSCDEGDEKAKQCHQLWRRHPVRLPQTQARPVARRPQPSLRNPQQRLTTWHASVIRRRLTQGGHGVRRHHMTLVEKSRQY